MSLNIFSTKMEENENLKENAREFLREEEKYGYVEIIRNDDQIINAKIANRKRVNFYLHYGAFSFKGKELTIYHIGKYLSIEIDGAWLEVNRLELNGFLDNISISVDY